MIEIISCDVSLTICHGFYIRFQYSGSTIVELVKYSAHDLLVIIFLVEKYLTEMEHAGKLNSSFCDVIEAK